MKKLLLMFSLSCFATTLFAQENSNSKSASGRNMFYAEIGGPGVMFSANFDRRFKNSRLGAGFRAGLGFVNASEQLYYTNQYGVTYYSQNRSVFTLPLQVNYVFGKPASPHSFEVGAGATILGKKVDIFDFYSSTPSQVLGNASFMYRRTPIDGGFTWRIGFTPIIGSGYIMPSAAAGVGYSF